MIKNIKIGDMLDKSLKVKDIFGGDNHENINENSALGIVYIVEDINTHKIHALKTFQDKYINDEEIFSDFKTESIEWVKLDPHPYIVTAEFVSLIDERPFIFIEPILPKNNKQNISHYFKDELSLKQILTWSIQFCYAMQFINSQGIEVHGDIKPANILIGYLNEIKITDFGLLKIIESTKNSLKEYYSSDEAKGTEQYCAPEVFKGKRSKQSDMYSFGLVLYQLVNNGKYPFEFDISTSFKKLHNTAKVPHSNSPLDNIIQKCLKKDYNDRYESFKDILEELEKIYVENFDENPEEAKLEKYPDEAKYMTLGHTYFVYRNIKLFKECYEKALINDNDYIRLNYSIDLLAVDDIEYAIENLKKINQNTLNENEDFEKSEDYEKLYFHTAEAYSKLNMYFDAIKYNKKCLKLNYDHFKSKMNLGTCYRIIGDFEKSLKYYNEILDKCPDNYSVLYNKIALLYDMNKTKEAEKLYNQLNGDDEKIVDKSLIQYTLGKNYKNSLIELSYYLAKHDDNINANYLAFRLHLKMKHPELAKEICDRISSIISDNTPIKLLFAYDFYEFGYPKIGLNIFNEIIASDNKKCKIESYLTKAYLLQNENLSEATRLINQIIDSKFSSKRQKSEAYNCKFVFTGNQYLKFLYKSLKLYPENIQTHLNFIIYYLNNNKFNEALKRIDISSKQFKNNAEILFLKGKVYFYDKKYEEALKNFKWALKYGKIDTEVWLYASKCNIKLNNYNDAFKYEVYAANLDKNGEFIDDYELIKFDYK